MQYGKEWRLFDVEAVHKGRDDPHNFLYCPKPLADSVLESRHSILLPDTDLEYEHTLGSCLLEFLILNPLFEGKTIEDVYDLVQLENLEDRARDLGEMTETQIGMFSKCW